MQFVTHLHNLVWEAAADVERVTQEYGFPIPTGMLTPSERGDFRPLTAAEKEQRRANDSAIIEESRKTLKCYQSAYDAERKRLLSSG